MSFATTTLRGGTGSSYVGEEEWLEGLYEPDELVVGKKMELPFPVKGSSEVKYWSAVLVDPNSAKPMKAGKAKAKGKFILE